MLELEGEWGKQSIHETNLLNRFDFLSRLVFNLDLKVGSI